MAHRAVLGVSNEADRRTLLTESEDEMYVRTTFFNTIAFLKATFPPATAGYPYYVEMTINYPDRAEVSMWPWDGRDTIWKRIYPR